MNSGVGYSSFGSRKIGCAVKCAKRWVRLVVLDLMLMDYGVYAMLGLSGKTMGDLSIAAIQNTESWLDSNGMGDIKIVATLMAGMNDSPGEITTIEDVIALSKYIATDFRSSGIGLRSTNSDGHGMRV